MFHDEFTISFTQDSVHDRNPHVPRPVSHDNKQLLDEVFARGGHLGIFWVGMCRPGLQIGAPF